MLPAVTAITADLFQDYPLLDDAIKENYNSKIFRNNLDNFTILNLTGERSFLKENNTLTVTYTFHSEKNLTNILIYDEIPTDFANNLKLKAATDAEITVIQKSIITIYYPTLTEYDSRSFSYSLQTANEESNFTEPLILQGLEKPKKFDPYSLLQYLWVLFVFFLGFIIWAIYSYLPKNILRRDWEGKVRPS